jgi:hypothetical protein
MYSLTPALLSLALFGGASVSPRNCVWRKAGQSGRVVRANPDAPLAAPRLAELHKPTLRSYLKRRKSAKSKGTLLTQHVTNHEAPAEEQDKGGAVRQVVCNLLKRHACL